MDLVGIEPMTSPACRGALHFLSDANRSIHVLIDGIPGRGPSARLKELLITGKRFYQRRGPDKLRSSRIGA